MDHKLVSDGANEEVEQSVKQRKDAVDDGALCRRQPQLFEEKYHEGKQQGSS